MKNGNNRKLFIRLLPLAIILTATLGAGIFDIAFSDVVPIRPYSGQFKFTPTEMIGRASTMGDIVIVTLVVILIASLIAAVANRTTGIVIAHTGFTPNANITGTPAVPAIVQLYPLFFAFLGLILVARHLKREDGGGI